MMSIPVPLSKACPPHGGTLEVHLLGLLDFETFLGLQEFLTFDLSGRQDLSGVLLLCEHPPAISVGRQGRSTDVHVDVASVTGSDIPIHWASRSGGAYAHAPGQLAIYLLLPLDRLGIGLVEYRRRLETAVCETCHELKVPAKRHPSSPGLWGRGGQLAFWGASIRSWISNHGMYLNVSISPAFLAITNPNPDQQRATSIQAHRIQPVPMSHLRESLIRTISAQFSYEMTDVSTGHPLLKRTSRQVATHV